jgi:hypothetical protein
MKALRCQTDGCPGAHLPAAKRNQGFLALRGGQPYLIGTCHRFPLVAKCDRCKRPSRWSAAEFARLPTLKNMELQAFGQLDGVTKDWEGFGLTRTQARQAVAYGLTGPSSLPDAPRPGQSAPAATIRTAPKPPRLRTGKRAPASGVYRSSHCGQTIPLAKRERFPPCHNEGANWTMGREA